MRFTAPHLVSKVKKLRSSLEKASTLRWVRERLGDAVRELRARDRVVVSSLIEPLVPPPVTGPTPGALIITLRPRAAALTSVLPPAYVQRAVEDSLRALRVDAIPLALINRWRDGWLDDRDRD